MNSGGTVFILGSGFSRAFSDAMPTVDELANKLRERPPFRESPYDNLVENPELLLSYLDLAQPWKEPEEVLRDQALFIETQKALAEEIARSEAQAFKHPVPEWAADLVQYLHETRTTVITLNYDTVLERTLHKALPGRPNRDGPREFDLYDMPLSVLRLRQSGTLGGEEVDTFRLVKLHGSINWFYSGHEGLSGEQIYFRAVTSDSPSQDDWGRSNDTDREVKRLTKDKTPLIVPPVSEKSRFYENRTIRALWTAARGALAQADEVWCVGYSLPETDLTMKLFLRSVARPKRVTIVNRAHGVNGSDQRILERYREAFPESGIDGQTFMGENSVQKMTEHLLGAESAVRRP